MRHPVVGLVLAAIIVLLASIVIIDLVQGEPAEPPRVPPATTITLPGPDAVVDLDQQLQPDEQQAAADPTPADEGPGVHEDMRDETPAGAPPDAPREVRSEATSGLGPPLPVGGAQTYECRRRFVRNRSSRNGAKVRLFVLHYTVSAPGTLDIIRGLFDRPSFAASSTFGFEVTTGRCELWVPPAEKAWTQGAFNSVSESVEIMARGDEPRSWWLAQPGLSKLAQLVADRLRARGLPPDYVDPVGCGVQRAGWTDHDSLECGNSHHDVRPAFPYDVFAARVKRFYYGGPVPKPVPRPTCSAVNIQAALRRLGFFHYPPNGVIGARTREAIRRFQRRRGLGVDGMVGPQTGRALGLNGCRG